MEHISVISSNIASIGYDPQTESLQVAFHSGGVYQSEGVPQHIYDQFVTAPSVGQFRHYNIKPIYPCARIG